MMRLLKSVTLAATVVLMSGCLTEPKARIDSFTYEMEPDQSRITTGVTVAALFSDISFLGQALIPNQCYRASSKLTADGFTLIVNVDITPTGSTTCNQQAAGIRYTGVIQNLPKGTYTVRIIQNVGGVGTTEFNEAVKL